MDRFRITSGGRAGAVFTPASDSFLAGRQPDAGLRFSADEDLAVSARHARFTRDRDAWVVEDLDSRNGTWVNGTRVLAAVRLQAGDTIRFGVDGPEVACEFNVGTAQPESTTRKLRAMITREKLRLRLIAASVLVVVLVFAAALALSDRQERAAWDADRSLLQSRIDSLLAAGPQVDSSLETEVAGLRSALRESEEHLRRLRAEAASTRRGGGNSADLERELLSATTALQRQQLAATLDFGLIQRRNRAAVAMVWVEYADGSLATGTAFSVRADGTLVTNRHLVEGQGGGLSPRRIAIRFSDSDQAFPGRVLAVSRSWDMAALAVDNIIGDVPAVGRLNTRTDTLPTGAPLAMIGFPLGGEPGSPSAAQVARPLVSAGLMLESAPGALELQGVGAAGASGSPILDAAGDVVGMLYGGRLEGGKHILMAVPAQAIAPFLSRLR